MGRQETQQQPGLTVAKQQRVCLIWEAEMLRQSSAMLANQVQTSCFPLLGLLASLCMCSVHRHQLPWCTGSEPHVHTHMHTHSHGSRWGFYGQTGPAGSANLALGTHPASSSKADWCYSQSDHYPGVHWQRSPKHKTDFSPHWLIRNQYNLPF